MRRSSGLRRKAWRARQTSADDHSSLARELREYLCGPGGNPSRAPREHDLPATVHAFDARLGKHARRKLGLDRGARDERHAVPGQDGAPHRLLESQLETYVEIAQAQPEAAKLVVDDPAHPRAFLHHDERLGRELVHVERLSREAVARRAHEHDLVVRERLELDAAVAWRRPDDPELELALRNELHHGPRVVDLERHPHCWVRALELAEEQRHDDGGRPRRGADREHAGELALRLRDHVGEHLLLQREKPLRAAVEAPPGLRGLHATSRPVEELRPEPLFERPNLQGDRRLRDAEPLGRLRERPPLDDRAERSKLTRVHKRSLSQETSASVREDVAMRVWIDVTNSPHIVFFRPLVALLEAGGHDVTITARDFAQTLELLEDASLVHTVVGPPHGGSSRIGKVRAMASRLRALRRFARGRGFDVALSHASHELPLVARSLGIPSSYAFDYEFALAQHTLGCRAATRVVVPDVIPQDRLNRLGARSRKVVRYPGLKEEYYLHGFEPDPGVLDALGLDRSRILAVVRTPPEVSLYHRHGSSLFADVLERLGRDPAVQAVVLPRTPAQRDALRGADLPSLIVPERAVDALSLVALADLVVSAGGTMNREAVALGTPVYTTFSGRLGAVDEELLAKGRLGRLNDAAELVLAPRPAASSLAVRDPASLLALMLSSFEASPGGEESGLLTPTDHSGEGVP